MNPLAQVTDVDTRLREAPGQWWRKGEQVIVAVTRSHTCMGLTPTQQKSD